MDSTSTPHPLVTSNQPDNLTLDDEKIKPMILAFNERIKLNSSVISKPTHDRSLQLGAIKGNDNDTLTAPDTEDHKEIDPRGVISSGASHPAETEEELWPKITDFDDRPLSPTSGNIAIKQVISESAYLSSKQTELDDHPSSPAVDASKPTISIPAYQSSKKTQPEKEAWLLSPDLHKTGMKPKVQMISEGAYRQPNEAMLNEFSLNSSSPLSSPTHEDFVKPRVQMIRDPAYQSPTHDSQAATIRESYRSSAQARLSSVVEESESFSRREFGVNALNYMSTFSSAKHATPQRGAIDDSAFNYKHVSYRHNNYHQFTYNLSTSHEPSNESFKISKSAPAGTATRTGSAFGLFRRGTSERSGLRMGRRTVYRPNKPRKPKTLASTLLWPLLKIRNGYVGCMMGLEGTGDLTGMMQGGTYATTTRYFADVPLSKSDSRNYG